MADQASVKKGTHVGLDEVTLKHLQFWHIHHRVFRAKPGDPFKEVDLVEDEELPLYKEGEQTLM